jgi:hypothetical protein
MQIKRLVPNLRARGSVSTTPSETKKLNYNSFHGKRTGIDSSAASGRENLRNLWALRTGASQSRRRAVFELRAPPSLYELHAPANLTAKFLFKQLYGHPVTSVTSAVANCEMPKSKCEMQEKRF